MRGAELRAPSGPRCRIRTELLHAWFSQKRGMILAQLRLELEGFAEYDARCLLSYEPRATRNARNVQ